jgi:hypothetical protein
LTDQSVIRQLKPFVYLLFTRPIRLRPLGLGLDKAATAPCSLSMTRYLVLTGGGLLDGLLQVGREIL